MHFPYKPVTLVLLSSLCLGITAPALADSHNKAVPVAEASATQSKTIVEIAAANDTFATLVTAVKAAGLVETLSGEGPFTVFAPTDEAFAALPEGTVETLLKPENKDKLVKILTYHVVSGAVTSDQVKPGQVTTVEGSPIEVKVQDGAVMINGAKVIATDVKASNGVIHVINQVILPPDA